MFESNGSQALRMDVGGVESGEVQVRPGEDGIGAAGEPGCCPGLSV